MIKFNEVLKLILISPSSSEFTKIIKEYMSLVVSLMEILMKIPTATLKDKDIEDLLENSKDIMIPEVSKEFDIKAQLATLEAKIDLLETLSKKAYFLLGDVWPKIADQWHDLRNKTETLRRRLELQSPESKADFTSALKWMAEQGIEDDLELVREARRTFPYADEEKVNELLKTTEERIMDRLMEPNYVMRREEEAYQKNKEVWDRRFTGNFIAIHRGEVIDSDENKSELIKRIIESQKVNGPFRAYIVEAGATLIRARGPRVRVP